MFGPNSVVLNGSSDRNARLWNAEANLAGSFGHANGWNLKKPSKSPWSHVRGETKENKKKKGSTKQPVLFSLDEPLRNTDQEAAEPPKHESSSDSAKNNKIEPKEDKQPQEPQLPRIDQPQKSSSCSTLPEDTAQSRVATPPLIQRKHESLFKHNLEEGLLKRIARRKIRRQVFGEINTEKVNQFGTACSAFHALATTEMETFTLPSNLPMTSRMVSKGLVCTTESDLKSMQLTFPELEEETVEEPQAKDRKKPLTRTRKPMLPPLIKPSRSRFSENKKTSGCCLPSVPTVPASASLKWGKY
ncbi:uncharacterized protein LOC110077810 [Pogona vitticeps]